MKLLLDAYLAIVNRAKTRVFWDGDLSAHGYLVLDSKGVPEGQSRKIQIYFSVAQVGVNLTKAAHVLLPFFYDLDLSAQFLLKPSMPLKPEKSLSSAGSAVSGLVLPPGQEICLEMDLDKINLEELKDILLTAWSFLSLHGLGTSVGYCETPPGHQEIDLLLSSGKIPGPFSYVVSEVLNAGAGAGAGGSAEVSASLSGLEITEADLSAYGLSSMSIHRMQWERLEFLRQQPSANLARYEKMPMLPFDPEVSPILEADFLRDGAPLNVAMLELVFAGKDRCLLTKLQFLETAFILIIGNGGRNRYATLGRHGSIFASHNIQYSDRQLNDIKALKDFYLKLIKSNLSGQQPWPEGFLALIKETIAVSGLVNFNRTRYRAWLSDRTGTRRETDRCLLAAPTLVFLRPHSKRCSLPETGRTGSASVVDSMDRK